MLEEMAHHIEQQNASQRYLEKLRAENERMALQEKERQVCLTYIIVSPCLLRIVMYLNVYRLMISNMRQQAFNKEESKMKS